MEVVDTQLFETLRTEAAREQAEAEALQTRRKERTRRPRQTASKEAVEKNVTTPSITVQGADGESIVLPPPRAENLDGPEARRRVEMQMKFNKVEIARQADQKFIRERAEKAKTMREDRFKRLVDAVCDHGGLSMECAESLAGFEKRYQQRRWDLYSQWDENVAHSLAKQAFDTLNPTDRSMQQKISGSRHISWKLPNEKPQLKLNVNKDPIRRQLLETEYEKAFDEVAEAVLGRPRSTMSISKRSIFMDDPRCAPGARALSRPVLEPTDWGQQQLQGTLFGRFAQVCEEGPDFIRARRGGPNVFIPDESDEIPVAGTRRSREFGYHGYHDMGILKGNKCSRGECSEYKTHEGMSSGAPAQDHYTFQNSKEITDLEFPLGKKVFPEFH